MPHTELRAGSTREYGRTEHGFLLGPPVFTAGLAVELVLCLCLAYTTLLLA